MMITHHVSDETLLTCASGKLAAGPSVVVRAHCDMCAECRERLSDLEAVGGALLVCLSATAMSEDALARALARLNADKPDLPSKRSADVSFTGTAYPRSLARHRIGRFRWLAPGFRRSRVALNSGAEANVFLMRIGAGRMMPEHGHSEREYTLVLSGSFRDELGHYGAGDFIELDSSVEHQPKVDLDGECVCLAALEGEMRLNGFFGRLLQRILPL